MKPCTNGTWGVWSKSLTSAATHKKFKPATVKFKPATVKFKSGHGESLQQFYRRAAA
jgi:hypothetical protein